MGSRLKCAMPDPAPTPHQTLVTLVRALRAITRGCQVTAASLARDLGVTADEVDAALAAAEARAAGLSIQSDGTLGLAPAFDALDAPGVAAAMAAAARHVFDVHVVPVSGSTNSDLMAHAASLPSGRVLVAELQTAGRGRRGRVWHAAPGGGLTFSLLWRFAAGAAALSGLSLVVGLAAARALDRFGARNVMLKWPNDLLVRSGAGWAKLGGILIEITGPAHGPAQAVIGIGLNLRLGATAPAIDQAATDLASIGVTASRNRLLAAVLEELALVLPGFASSGFAPFMEQWNARHAFRNQPVIISGADGAPAEGIAIAALTDGALQVELPGGRHRVVSGEVSLRAAPAR